MPVLSTPGGGDDGALHAGRAHLPEVSLVSLLVGPLAVFIGALLAALYPALRLFRCSRWRRCGRCDALSFATISTLAWRNLWRNSRRTLIMLAAIAVGVWAMILWQR